jgi:hypothetical protein
MELVDIPSKEIILYNGGNSMRIKDFATRQCSPNVASMNTFFLENTLAQ